MLLQPDDHLTVAKESNTEEREISKDGNHSLVSFNVFNCVNCVADA